MVPGVEPLRVAYITLFALTAVACFGVIPRARNRLSDPDTRWGLVTLLALSGLWATFHVGRLVAPMRELKVAFYTLGLIAGLATVGAWLYFCSAYASRSYHRESFFRWAALGIYAAIVAAKLTSPIHGHYFTTAYATAPFPHLVIQFGIVHWVVTGLAYALSAVGFYILFDLFQNSGHATGRLGYLVGLAGLPVVFDVAGYASRDWILTFNYEPVGVGLFALGVLYVADGTFLAVRAFGREQLIDELGEAIVLLDGDGVVRDANAAAVRLFPALADATGERLATVVPDLAEYLPVTGPELITRVDGDATSYYLLSTPQLTAGQTTVGEAIVFTDVTRIERQRRQIEQQQSQLDDFAEAITHELRNTLNILEGHIDLSRNQIEAEENQVGLESLETAGRMTDRMSELISDLATLAQFGHAAEDVAAVDVEAVAERAFATVAGAQYELGVEFDTVQADEIRLERLFEKLFGFAVANGATRVDVSQTADGFTVADDGEPLDELNVEAAFTYGQAVPDAETGMFLPIARTLAKAHGWEITIDPDYRSGVRFVVTT